jgi:hypothetical protein
MIAPIVAPLGSRSIASTADCLDDPASIAFDGAGLNEADFGFNAGTDDFDATLEGTRTLVGRFAGCPDLRALFTGLDLSFLVAIFALLCLNDSITCCHRHSPADKVGRALRRRALLTRAI